MEGAKPYEFIRFGAMDVTRPYEFIRFGAMDVTKPYEFIGFGAIRGLAPRPLGCGRKAPESKSPRHLAPHHFRWVLKRFKAA